MAKIILACFVVNHSTYSCVYGDDNTAICQVLPVLLAAQVRQVQLDHLEFREFLATQAVLATLVYPEVQGLGVLQDFRVLRVPSEPPVQQVVFSIQYVV